MKILDRFGLSPRRALLGTAAASLVLPGLAAAAPVAPTTVADYAALRALGQTVAGVLVAGALASGDGGGGSFFYDAGDTTSADDGGTVIVTAAGARYHRVYAGAMHIVWFGGFTAAAVTGCIAAAMAAGKSVRADAGLYDMGAGGVAFAQGVGDFTFTADRMAIFQSTGDGSSPVFSFTNVGANFSWSGGQYGYATAPTVRAADVLDFWGAAITNIHLAEIRINNGANFGIWVRGLAASGCSGLVARDIEIFETLGDGLHVENFDSDLFIDGVIGVNNGDDVCAVVNYQAVHPNPTYQVLVDNVSSTGPGAAVLKLLGVDGFSAGNIVGRNATGASACVLNLGVGAGYGTVLRNGAFGNIVGENITNVVYPGVADGIEIGNVTFGAIIGSGITGNGIQIVGTAASNIHNINFGKIVLSGAAAAGTVAYPAENFGLWIAYASRIDFDAIQVTGFYQNVNVYRCNEISFAGPVDSVDAYPSTLGGDNSFGVQIQNNTGLVLNDVGYRRVRSPKTQNGVIVNDNTTVETRGQFSCAAAAAATGFIFGGNTGVSGFIRRQFFSVPARAVRAGVSFVFAYTATPNMAGRFVCCGVVQTGGSGPAQAVMVTHVTGSQITVNPAASDTAFAMSGEVATILD